MRVSKMLEKFDDAIEEEETKEGERKSEEELARLRQFLVKLGVSEKETALLDG